MKPPDFANPTKEDFEQLAKFCLGTGENTYQAVVTAKMLLAVSVDIGDKKVSPFSPLPLACIVNSVRDTLPWRHL